jgi:uncharacterized protein
MTEHRKWHHEPMVWLIIALPLISVVLGISLYVIADRTYDGLVLDDYYKKGKEINLTLARDQAAAHAGLRGMLQLNSATQQVQVTLAAKNPASLPAQMTLRWLHATRAGFDRTQVLEREARGGYRTDFPELAPGHWYVQLEAQDWRLMGSLRVPQDIQTVLKPSPVAGGAVP